MRLRIWIGWSLFGLGLVGLAFALDATLPPQPRCVLRGSFFPGVLSADGTLMTSGTPEAEAESSWCVSLKTWDTVTGRERGEFFRGLLSPDAFEPPRGFSPARLVYSPDNRYCALVHQRGLALADLHSGREWPEAIKSTDLRRDLVSQWPPEKIALYRLLQQPIDTTGLQEKIRLWAAFEHISAKFEGKLPVRIDREALAAHLGPDASDPLEEMVCLPRVPDKMIANTALRLVLAQVGKGEATYLIRDSFVEITTARRRREENDLSPAFSPRGSFVVLLEGRPERNMLHVVECATGELLASLALHADACDDFGFTPDESMLFFFADDKKKPLLSVWNTRTRQTVRTFPEVALLASGEPPAYQVCPDSKLLLADTAQLPGGGLDLFDLSTGARHRLLERPGNADETKAQKKNPPLLAFSPDGQILARLAETGLQTWDLPTGNLRTDIKFAEPAGHWRELAISTNPRLCIAADYRSVCVWDLDAGKLLWRRHGPMFAYDPLYAASWDRRFLVEFTGDRMDILDQASGDPRATLRLGERDVDEVHVLSTSADGRSMLTWWMCRANRPPSLGEEWLGQWWPFPRSHGSFVVTDVATGRTQLRLDFRIRPSVPQFSQDGRTLMSDSYEDDDTKVVRFWDVPGQSPRLWVLGVPAALAGAAMLLRWWFTRRKGVPRPAAGASGVVLSEATSAHSARSS